MIKIIILDDDKNFLSSLSKVIELSEDIRVLGTFLNAIDAMKFLEENEVDICLTDIHLGSYRMNGIEFITIMKTLKSSILFLILTIFDEHEKVFQALSAGALGYITKSSPKEDIIKAIYDIYNGGSPMTQHIARKVAASFSKSTVIENRNLLTSREQEVLKLIGDGKIEKEVASILNISASTVKNHISNIYTKLHVNTRVEALNKYYGKI
jgi:DNA-binding NarL/FixJ family response regulator